MDELVAKVGELRVTVEQAGRKREALELEFYRATDATTKRWEALEQRLVEQVAELRRELTTHKELEDNAALSGDLERNRQLAAELCSCEEAAAVVREENETLRLEKEELKAELAYVQARTRRIERTARGRGESGTSG